MATKKISNLVELTAPAIGDLLLVVDISEALDVDKNKKITLSNMGKAFDVFANLKKVSYGSLYDAGNSGTAKTIDWATNGNIQKVTLTGDCTFSFTAPAGPCHLTLILEGDGTARTLTWPATVIWLTPGEPAWSGTSGDKNIVSLFYDGADYIVAGGVPN